ncbi:hypothetical protein E2K93_08625 [Thalassotalea sp. HSM 43]|uniref:GTPase-activating protein n=1 Tax=Thalassotalea sp. HSM 43 TaxID=2552945 RepID=UPI001081A02F|nr:GTPase-activating protein [Thalassotalea sp. HSM 43]QBY04450.1 hypothetical protein E2K93_08625 [Thalassotalea sp. HSM 43]
MARSKKSRKEGALMKKLNLKRPEKAEKEQRKRKMTGNKAGTRQNVAKNNTEATVDSSNKDPRLGSKKAIDLGIKVKSEKPQAKKAAVAPIAPVRVVDDAPQSNDVATSEAVMQAYEQELHNLENNEQLMLISALVESGEDISPEQMDMLDKAQSRYQELMDLLGYEQPEQDDELADDDDDEALWDRLDDSDFSDYKE